jgi:uncharacterized protein (TIGR03437 family)
MGFLRSRRPLNYASLCIALIAIGILSCFVIFTTSRTRAIASPQQRLDEIDQQLGNPRLLLLRNAQFDPRESEPEPLRIGNEQLETTAVRAVAAKYSAQQTETGNAYFIIQYEDRIRAEWTADLHAQGIEIVGYVANNGYIVRAPRAGRNRAQAAQNLESHHSSVRWVGAYGPGLKVENELARLTDNVAAGNLTELGAEPTVAVSFLTFRGENSSAIRATLNQLDPAFQPVIEERYDGRAWGVVRIALTDLPRVVTALASVEGVEWIEQRRRHRLFNDSGVKIIQNGTTANDTPLFRKGLTGAGQIFGNADSGLDADHAQFRLDGQASAQTFSFATSTQSLVNGLLPVSITNPNNKILTYYLLGTGSLINNAANPNGGRTLDPNQQQGGGFLNSVAYDDNDGYHGTHTTSVAAGRDFNADGTGAVPGLATRTAGDGMAPDARIVFQDVGHPNGELPGVDRISQALLHQQAYASGVRVHNNSYGPPPPVPYDTDAADIDDIMWRLRDYTIFFSAGNDSAGTGRVASVAKNNIVVAATDSPTNNGSIENIASYSNHGPTFDGRIKPDIAVPGSVRAATETTGIPASQFGTGVQTSTTAVDAAINPSAANNNRSLSGIAGTSFSSPMAAGGALLVRQYFTDGFYPGGAAVSASGFNPSNALVKGIILNSGRNMTGRNTASDGTNGASGPLPNFGQGWGRMALDDALFFTGDRRELKVLADIWNGATASDNTRPAPNAAITTGVTHTYQLSSVSTIEPLRITLVWSDPKASLSTQTALVNNLDLEVTDPQGTVFRGNANFTNAYSQPASGAAFDSKNPVEAIYIQYPLPGVYTVRVIGANVPGNGQTGIIAQPGNQAIDSNRQGYALIATGNFTAGAQSLISLNSTSVSGGVNADRFISRNETATATVTATNQTVVAATNVSVQLAVDAASQIPANLIRINGQPAGQSAAISYGDIGAQASRARAFQITLVDDGVNRSGQQILFNVTMTPANGPATTTQFTITVGQKLITYRTRFEPTADPGGTDIIPIPESAWSVRPDNPNTAPTGDSFNGPWPLTTNEKADGSTASLSDPSGPGSSYGTSSTPRSGGGTFDDARWWTTRKIILPGLDFDQTTDKVSNPSATAQIAAAVESFDVDVKADFTGDVNQSNLAGDLTFLRVRPYKNTALSVTTDTGFNDQTFTNLLRLESSTPSTNGFRHFGGSSFDLGNGVFAVDPATPDNSDVAFRLELQLRRNNVLQTGDGIFYDNLVVRLRVNDPAVYNAPADNASTSVDAASYARAAAPGQILAGFGGGFPAGMTINAGASSLPLPTQLGNVSVRVNGILAPLFFVGVGLSAPGAFQINYQLPYETQTGVAFVEVLNNGAPVTSEFLNVSLAAPGVFTANATGSGQAAVLNQDFSLNGDPAQIPNAKPEARGRFIIVYANGQGAQLVNAATQQPLAIASGVPATASPLYATLTRPTVTIGGIAAQVDFSGLAPGFVGLWQLNVLVPNNAPTGNAVPLIVSFDGRTSATTTVAIN